MASDEKSQNTDHPIPRKALSLFHLGQSLLFGGIFSLILFEIIPSIEFLLRLNFGTVPGGRVGFGVVLLILGALGGLLIVAMLRVFGPIFRATESDAGRELMRERRWPLVFLGAIPVIGILFVVKTMFSGDSFLSSAVFGVMIIGFLLHLVAQSHVSRTS